MDVHNRWRHAIIISIGLNLCILCGVGIIFPGVFQTEPVEGVIELDLVSDYSNSQSIESILEQAKVSGVTRMESANSVTASAMTTASVAVQTVTSLTVDEVSSDLGREDSIRETQAVSSPTSGSVSGSSTLDGGAGQPSIGKNNSGQGLGKGSGGILGPQILSQVHPTYPEDARKAGATGKVLLKVQILETGRAGEVHVQQSSGNTSLDQSAVTAVYKWRFTPAKEKNTGRAVVCYTTLPVVFRLN